VAFREDHEAALARAEALDRELERNKDKLEDATEEVARLRQENKRLRAASEPGIVEPGPAPYPPPSRYVEVPDAPDLGPVVTKLMIWLMIAVIVGGLGVALYLVISGPA